MAERKVAVAEKPSVAKEEAAAVAAAPVTVAVEVLLVVVVVVQVGERVVDSARATSATILGCSGTWWWLQLQRRRS